MRLNRNKVSIFRSIDGEREEPAHLSKSEALSFVWELTEEVFSLARGYDVESRLQRDVISLIRS